MPVQTLPLRLFRAVSGAFRAGISFVLLQSASITDMRIGLIVAVPC